MRELLRLFRRNPVASEAGSATETPQGGDLGGLTAQVTPLGRSLNTTAGALIQALETAAGRVDQEATHFRELLALARELEEQNRSADDAAGRMRDTAGNASGQVVRWRGEIETAMQAVQELTGTVGAIGEQVNTLKDALENVTGVAASITSIAEQTNLLALNATIEATRAGEVGRAFAVVAEHVKELARQTAEATAGLRELLTELTERIDALTARGAGSSEQAGVVRQEAETIVRLMAAAAAAMADIERETGTIGQSVGSIDGQCHHLVDGLKNMDGSVDSANRTLQDSLERGAALAEVTSSLAAVEEGNGFVDVAETLGGVAIRGRHVCVEVSDIAGAVDRIGARVSEHAGLFDGFLSGLAELRELNQRVDQAARNGQHVAATVSADFDQSDDSVAASTAAIGELADGVSAMYEDLQGLNDALVRIGKAARGVDAIARQTNLLALNASIEAARSGGAEGHGFLVVADEVKKLAHQTSIATTDIDRTLQRLGDQAAALLEVGEQGCQRAMEVRNGTASLMAGVRAIGGAMVEVDRESGEIVQAVSAIDDLCDRLHAGLTAQIAEVGESSVLIDTLRGQVDSMLGRAEELLNVANNGTIETPDQPFIARAREAATAVSRVFEQALEAGEISREELFDRQHRPVQGTEPQQYLARHTLFTDRVLPEIQEPVYASAGNILACCTTDDTGYIATHNLHVSKSQRPDDPVWNAANCRNRRVFDDRVGLAAAHNTRPFLLQAYRRNMGDRFVLTMDASAPVHVAGRHWGAVRVIYLPEA